MPKRPVESPKLQSLRQHGTLNLHPRTVVDELFAESQFFDPHDLVQVKYEMLRRVRSDGRSITQAAAVFGFSRPAFYQAQASFTRSGLQGLMPHKRGPKRAHKLTGEILDFVRQERQADPALRTADLVQRVKERFNVLVHSRTIERGLRRDQKKHR